ncbi:MAG: hypothetical protein ACE5HE_09135 [Phycisphaerae bacterium]
MGFLKGKKTMIGSVAAGLLVIAFSLGLIDEKLAGLLAGLVTAWTGVALRLAIRDDK